jgi:hypothetical protein
LGIFYFGHFLLWACFILGIFYFGHFLLWAFLDKFRSAPRRQPGTQFLVDCKPRHDFRNQDTILCAQLTKNSPFKNYI